MTNLFNPTEEEVMTMRNLGGTLSRELARTGFAVVAVAAVILIYQGCSQPVEPVAEDTAAPGAVNAQEEAMGTEAEEVESVPEGEPEADIALEAPAQLEEPPVEGTREEMMMAQTEEGEAAEEDIPAMTAEPEMPTKAVAVITPTVDNDVTGTVTFTQQDDGVLIEAHINGLEPGKHGFHIHEFGDLRAPDGTSAGGHYAPEEDPHGAPDAGQRHMGDLGNLEAGEDGHAMYSRVDEHVKLHYIIGRAVVVHGGEDDLTSQPSGAAGPRVGIGVVGIANPEAGQ